MNKDEQTEKILSAAKNARIFESIDAVEALSQTKQRLGLGEEGNKTQKLALRRTLRIAASIAVIISIGWAVYLNMTAENWTVATSGATTKEYKLPDGTIVTLNRNSTIEVRENMRDERLVKLQGEAFFDVKRDVSRPFRVSVDEVDVEVLGTSFNIRSQEARTLVSVASGKVRVNESGNDSNELVLVKNQSAMFDNSTGLLERKEPDPNYLAWKTGIFSFDSTPVEQALQAMAGHHGMQIVFDSPDLIKNCTVTSVFDNQSWNEIKEELSLIHALKFTVRNDTTFISGGTCQ